VLRFNLLSRSSGLVLSRIDPLPEPDLDLIPEDVPFAPFSP
jgi:hypothetical protein